MYLISTKIDSPDKYILSWKNFVIVNGISQTLNYIEPQTKSKRQDVIDYIKKNKSKYILTVSPNDKRLKSKKMREKLYGAYLYGTLKEFSKQFVNN